MDCEAAIKCLKERFGINLNAAQETVFRGAWEGKTYDQISSESPDFPNVKYLSNDIGPNLWQMLSDRLDEKISKSNLRAMIESYFSPLTDITTQETLSSRKNIIDWGEAPYIPMLQFFEEREKQMKELEALIFKRQLVTLTGLNGIGKTTVGVKLVEQFVKDEQFEAIIWRSLNYDPPPSLDKILENLLKVLRPVEFKEIEPKINLTQNISLLIDCFRKKRCLVILDHLESLMKKEQDVYAEYAELIERVGKERHHSCLLLITQEKPKDVNKLEEEGFSVSSYILRGLKEDIKKNFLDYKLSNPDRWDELIEIFKGHPFALQNVANKIKHIFGGNVEEYLKERTLTIRDINNMLAQEIKSLSDLERRIIFVLSRLSNEQQVSFSELKQKLIELEDESSSISGAILQDALEVLLQRSLILGEKKYRLDPIVQKYINNKPDYEVRNSLDSTEVPQNLDKLNFKEQIQLLEELFDKS